MTLLGAELLFYPTAIGTERTLFAVNDLPRAGPTPPPANPLVLSPQLKTQLSTRVIIGVALSKVRSLRPPLSPALHHHHHDSGSNKTKIK